MTVSSSPDHGLGLWLGKPVPRYTSYPTAPLFHAGIGAEAYRHDLCQLANGRAALYLHIPFCHELCLYCGCHTSVTQRQDRLDAYQAALQHEATLIAAITGRLKIGHLHLGGGTPNILSAEGFDALFTHLHQLFDFDDRAEIATEIDPRHIDADKIAMLAHCGITRVSLGIQDFDPRVQEIVQRREPFARVAEVCATLRAAGIKRINLDLMYGLPLQTPQSVTATAMQCMTLAPDRMALFAYAHVPQLKPHQRALEAHGIPDAAAMLAMDSAARAVFTAHGYRAIGIDHFAQPDDPLWHAAQHGALRRNFQGYTDAPPLPLIALGASAIGQTPAGYYQNEKDTRRYQDLIATGQLPIVRGLHLSNEDRLRATVIERLMCDLALDLDRICAAFGTTRDHFATELAALRPYSDAGLIEIAGGTIRLTSPHRMAVRVIAAQFDQHSAQKQKIYARTA